MEAVGGSCDCAFSSSSFDTATHLDSDHMIFTWSGRSSLESGRCLPSPFCPVGVPAAVGVEAGAFQLLFVETCLTRKYLGSPTLIQWRVWNLGLLPQFQDITWCLSNLPVISASKQIIRDLFPVLFSSVLFYVPQFLKEFFEVFSIRKTLVGWSHFGNWLLGNPF